MASPLMIDERTTTETTPLPNRDRARRFVALYAILALLAVSIGIAVGLHRHDAMAIGHVAVPTEQSVVATAQPGIPTPTSLATKPPSPTPIPPTEPPATVSPPTPIPPAAPAVVAPVRSVPAVNVNQNGQNDKGKGNGKEKGKGD